MVRIRFWLTVASLAVGVLVLGAGRGRAEVTATPGGIRFSYSGPNASSVQLAGSFNNWTGEAMDREADGLWSKVVRLGAGLHEYKFVVDGQWVADPENPVSVGDFGNSGVSIGEDGRLAPMEATSNTPYSARILVSGRTIDLYRSRKNPESGDRFELRRPSMDTDFAFDVRVNDVMDATVVTNINNEAENIEAWRTRLNFDRGLLHFDTGELEGWAWDNFDVGTWDDPLHLVGDIGIYEHPFGFNTQGAMLRKRIGPVDARILYSDDFRPSQTGPAVAVLTPESAYEFRYLSDAEDILAGRATVDVGGVRVGVSARLDRGYNPGGDLLDLDRVMPATLVVADTTLPDTLSGFTAFVKEFSATSEEWSAVGVDAMWPEAPGGMTVSAEVLFGQARIDARNGIGADLFASVIVDPATSETTLVSVQLSEAVPVEEKLTLDDSWRLYVGVENVPRVAGVEMETGLEFQRHRMSPLAVGVPREITNDAWTWNADLRRPSRFLGRRVEPSLGLEFHYFDYDGATPWQAQTWFDFRNFWLENGEHVVSYERLTLLGGEDALILRPAVEIEVLASPEVTFEYVGTIAGPGFGREPSYVETLLKGTWKIAPRWRAHTDFRFVKYNHRPLDLNDAFNETFWELAYEVSEGIELALSYGVDPWAMDEPVNEYDYIGRDLFLFARGANGATARDDYLSLAEVIPAAESALANERVLQLEAIVRF